MKPKAYIETSVISYLTARPSRDVVQAGHQQITRDWWQNASDRFDLVISEFVRIEASAGDANAARSRLAIIDELANVEATPEALGLAKQLVNANAVPTKAGEDAALIAIAVVGGATYLVTWNCRHIANAAMRHRIEQVCRDAGYAPIIICTPEELMEPNDG